MASRGGNAKRVDEDVVAEQGLLVQRGSIVTLKKKIGELGTLALVVSNDIQNEAAEFLIVAPLERRKSRLEAPFAVNLGRSEGLRDLHTARCDRLMSVAKSEVKSLERARVGEVVLSQLEEALAVALGFSRVI